MTDHLTRPSMALLKYAPGDIPGAIATLFDCMFQDPHGDTDAQGMIAVTREILGMFASARVPTERLQMAAKSAFDRAATLADRIDSDPSFRAEVRGEPVPTPPTPDAKPEGAPAEAGDASGMEVLLPADFEDRDFVLDEGSDLALQLEQALGWIRNSARYLFLALDAPTGILLTGPTGTGKTTAAHRLAAKCGKALLIARHDALPAEALAAIDEASARRCREARAHRRHRSSPSGGGRHRRPVREPLLGRSQRGYRSAHP